MDVTGSDPRTRTGLFLWPWASYPAVAANAVNHVQSQANGMNPVNSTGSNLYSNMFGMPTSGTMNGLTMSEDPLETFYQRFSYPGTNMPNIIPSHNRNFTDNRHLAHRERELTLSTSPNTHGRRMSSPHTRHSTSNMDRCGGDFGSSHASAIAAFASATGSSGTMNCGATSNGPGPRQQHSRARDPVLDNLCNGLSRAGAGYNMLDNGVHSNGSSGNVSMNTSPTEAINTAYNQLRSQHLKAAALAVAVAQGRNAKDDTLESEANGQNSLDHSAGRSHIASHPSAESYPNTQSNYLFNHRSPQSDPCEASRDQLGLAARNSMNLMRANRFMSGLTDKSATAFLFRNSVKRDCSPEDSLDYRSSSETVIRDSSRCRPTSITPTTGVDTSGANQCVANNGSICSITNASSTFPNATKGYKCKICQHVCFSRHDLSAHNAAIHKQDPRPYRCEQCGRQFTTCAYLSQHRRIHTGVKPYACRFCDRRFTQLSHVQQHERIHTGEKPYRCSTCMKSFTQMSNLQSHQRQHMKGKPHRCEQCFMSFDTKDELDLHVQAKHSGNRYAKVLVCPICTKSYNSETYLAKHLDRHKEAASGASNPSETNVPNIHGSGVDDLFGAGFPTNTMAMAAAAALSRGARAPLFHNPGNLHRAVSDSGIDTNPENAHRGNHPVNYSSTENELLQHLPHGLQQANLVAAAAAAHHQTQRTNLGKIPELSNRFPDLRTRNMFTMGPNIDPFSQCMTQHHNSNQSPPRQNRADYVESPGANSNNNDQPLLNLTQGHSHILQQHRIPQKAVGLGDQDQETYNTQQPHYSRLNYSSIPPPAHQDSVDTLKQSMTERLPMNNNRERSLMMDGSRDEMRTYSIHPSLLPTSIPISGEQTSTRGDHSHRNRRSPTPKNPTRNALEFLLQRQGVDEQIKKSEIPYHNNGELSVDVNLEDPDSPDSVLSTYSGKLIEKHQDRHQFDIGMAENLATPVAKKLDRTTSNVVSELAKMLPHEGFCPPNRTLIESRKNAMANFGGEMMANKLGNYPTITQQYDRDCHNISRPSSPGEKISSEPEVRPISPGTFNLHLIAEQNKFHSNSHELEDPIKSSWVNRELIPLKYTNECRSSASNLTGSRTEPSNFHPKGVTNSSTAKSTTLSNAQFDLDTDWREYDQGEIVEQSKDGTAQPLQTKDRIHDENPNDTGSTKRRRRHQFVPQHLPNVENTQENICQENEFYTQEYSENNKNRADDNDQLNKQHLTSSNNNNNNSLNNTEHHDATDEFSEKTSTEYYN